MRRLPAIGSRFGNISPEASCVTEQTKQLSPLDALRRSIQATRDEAEERRLSPPPRGAAGPLMMLVVAGVALTMTDAVGGASDWAALARLLAEPHAPMDHGVVEVALIFLQA